MHPLGRLVALRESRRGNHNEVSFGRSEGVRERQGLGKRYSVVDEVEEATSQLRRLCLELVRRQVAVDHVRRAQRLQVLMVVPGSSRDDRGEARETCELYHWREKAFH